MRCPFKFKEFSDPERQQCEEDCALLTDNFSSSDEPRGICAITLIGTALNNLDRSYAFIYSDQSQDIWFQHNEIDL